jgi:hypothetical protein
MAALVVLLVAVVGYAIVNFSEASNYRFYIPASKLNGGAGPYSKKDGSGSYKLVKAGRGVTTWVNKSKLQGTFSVCSYFYKASNDPLMVGISVGGEYYNTIVVPQNNRRGRGNYVCSKQLYGIQKGATVRVQVLSGTAGVKNIYGQQP